MLIVLGMSNVHYKYSLWFFESNQSLGADPDASSCYMQAIACALLLIRVFFASKDISKR